MTMRKVPKRVGSTASASRVTVLAPVVHTRAAGAAAGKRRPRAFAFITQPRRSGHAAGSAMQAITGARRALQLRGRCDGHATLFQVRSNTGPSWDQALAEQFLGAVCPPPVLLLSLAQEPGQLLGTGERGIPAR